MDSAQKRATKWKTLDSLMLNYLLITIKRYRFQILNEKIHLLSVCSIFFFPTHPNKGENMQF